MKPSPPNRLSPILCHRTPYPLRNTQAWRYTPYSGSDYHSSIYDHAPSKTLPPIQLRLSASDWRHAACAIVLPLLCRDDRASLWNRKSCPYLTLIPEMAQYPFHILIPETGRRWNTAQLLDQRFNLSHCTLAKVTVIWLQSIILRGASWSTQTYLPPAEPKKADLYLIQRAHYSTILVHTFSGHLEKGMIF